MRERVREIVFEAETPAGKAFDVALIVAICASLLVVSLESVEGFRSRHGVLLTSLEWTFTGLFTVEYLVRLWCAGRRWRYAFSFFGLVDLLSVLPTWIGLVLPGARAFLVVRSFRVLRVFRVLKLAQFVGEAGALTRALHASRHKVTVFLIAVLCVVIVVGAAMHLIEGPEHGYTSIPQGMYWAIVTMTTVGYGDVVPQTVLGKSLSALLMILGYGVLAVPTGIVSAELVKESAVRPDTGPGRGCAHCGLAWHAQDARYCRRCGTSL